MDSFRAHLTDKVKKEVRKAGGVTAIIPGGCTSKLQPLDVSVNKPFKSLVRSMWIQYIRDEVQRVKEAKAAGDVEAKMKPASKQTIIDWVSAACTELTQKPELIKKSFVVTGISSKLNGSEDHLIGKEEQLPSVFTEDEDEDADFLGFTDEEIAHALDKISVAEDV